LWMLWRPAVPRHHIRVWRAKSAFELWRELAMAQ
jgi:hypothetical protein